MGKTLKLTTLLTMACACWLATMEMVLRHPGYAARACVAVCIAVVCAAVLLARRLYIAPLTERWFWLAAIAFIGLGASALYQNSRAAHFEGFVLVISLILILQGLLMLLALGKTQGHDASRSAS